MLGKILHFCLRLSERLSLFMFFSNPEVAGPCFQRKRIKNQLVERRKSRKPTKVCFQCPFCCCWRRLSRFTGLSFAKALAIASAGCGLNSVRAAAWQENCVAVMIFLLDGRLLLTVALIMFFLDILYIYRDVLLIIVVCYSFAYTNHYNVGVCSHVHHVFIIVCFFALAGFGHQMESLFTHSHDDFTWATHPAAGALLRQALCLRLGAVGAKLSAECHRRRPLESDYWESITMTNVFEAAFSILL